MNVFVFVWVCVSMGIRVCTVCLCVLVFVHMCLCNFVCFGDTESGSRDENRLSLICMITVKHWKIN